LDVIIAALRLADFFGHVGQIHDAVGIELRPAADHHHDVGARPRLDRRGRARLDVVGVDRFEVELDAERLLAFLGDLALEDLIGGRDEIGPAHPMHGRPLRIGGRPARREDGGEATGARCRGTRAGKLQKPASRHARHRFLPESSGAIARRRWLFSAGS
jgi:hypothetical protein